MLRAESAGGTANSVDVRDAVTASAISLPIHRGRAVPAAGYTLKGAARPLQAAECFFLKRRMENAPELT